VIACGQEISGATIDTPVDELTHVCAFAASITDVRVMGGDGSTLAEWNTSSSASWVRQPTADDIAQYYPGRAQRLGVSGKASVQCATTGNGSLERCSVVSEKPSDQGFGDAALKLSRLYKTTATDGRMVSFSIAFGAARE
jgi:TonB family protein